MEKIQKDSKKEFVTNRLCGFCRGPYDDACCGKFDKYNAPWIGPAMGQEIKNDLINMISMLESNKQITRDSNFLKSLH